MDEMEPFKRGYLLTPPQGKILKRTWQRKYYALYQASNLGIQRVEIFDSDDQYLHNSANKLIPLSDCVKVVQAPQKNQPNVFEVICKNQLYQFSAETTQELAEWIAAFQTVAFGLQRRESHPTLAGIPCRNSNPLTNETQQEENMLYSSMSGPEIYTVVVKDTDASRRCGLRGSYQLVITPIHIALSLGGKCPNAANIIFTWPYKFIRRFQRDRETFTFEAGRKSESGEGFFVFTTAQGNAIFHTVSEYLKTYTKKDANAYTPKPIVPESRTTNERNSYEGNVPKDINKVLPKTPPTAALPPLPLLPNESLYENTMPGQSKLRPPIAKPPRKNKLPSVSSQGNENNEPQSSQTSSESTGKVDKNNASPSLKLQPHEVNAKEHEVVSNTTVEQLSELKPSLPVQNSELVYDEPEQRVDAWKTFGLEKDILHTENMLASDETGAMYASVDVTAISPPIPATSPSPSFRSRNKSVPEGNTSRPVLAGRQFSVVASRPCNSGNYDRLFQFHVPTNRVNPQPDHIYKKLGPTHLSDGDVTSLQEDYSTVQDGYQVVPTPEDESYIDPIDCVPKPETKPILKGDEVPHFVENEEMYSIVIKPNKITTK